MIFQPAYSKQLKHPSTAEPFTHRRSLRLDKADAPAHSTGTALGCGRGPKPQGKPAKSHGEPANATQTVALAGIICPFLTNIIMKQT